MRRVAVLQDRPALLKDQVLAVDPKTRDAPRSHEQMLSVLRQLQVAQRRVQHGLVVDGQELDSRLAPVLVAQFVQATAGREVDHRQAARSDDRHHVGIGDQGQGEPDRIGGRGGYQTHAVQRHLAADPQRLGINHPDASGVPQRHDQAGLGEGHVFARSIQRQRRHFGQVARADLAQGVVPVHQVEPIAGGREAHRGSPAVVSSWRLRDEVQRYASQAAVREGCAAQRTLLRPWLRSFARRNRSRLLLDPRAVVRQQPTAGLVRRRSWHVQRPPVQTGDHGRRRRRQLSARRR